MGLFSKKQVKASSALPEETVIKIIDNFQSWIPDAFSKEINGETCTSKELKLAIELLVRVSLLGQDEVLLTYVAKNCSVFQNGMEGESIESLAQWLFDGTCVSFELQRKYKDLPNALLALSAIGLSALSVLEKHTKFSEALRYMSDNADKLVTKN